MEEKIPKCPFCNSDKVRPIQYGLIEFRSEKEREEYEKKYYLGGCVISEDSPAFHCDGCGKNFGSLKDLKEK